MIVILTDFGNSEYVGTMKLKIKDICPDAEILDLCNHVTPHAIKEGAWILYHNYAGSESKIYLCVIDPGVGSERQALAVKSTHHYFVGPDNGVLWPSIKDDGLVKAVALPIGDASKTFHGRDLFAPAAALLEKGYPLEKLGTETEIKEKLEFYREGRDGEIVKIDSFGNIVTTLPHTDAEKYKVITESNELSLSFYSTYASAPEDKLFLIEGSNNSLEISIKNGSAQAVLNQKIGNKIRIEGQKS